ncbi:MAG: hypothetical protein QOJ68_253, partial [Blastococcus sp.]|nr:hypothetical protein [Blastococcus sp.]
MSSRGVARRRGSPLRGLGIFVLVGALLGAALFFGDRWARQQAEDAVATQRQARLAT